MFALAVGILALGALSICIVGLYVIILILSHTPRPEHPTELEYSGIDSSGKLDTSLREAAQVKISVVVPCYNEEKRLPLMLQSSIPYLKKHYGTSWELLIVDDGSSDQTRRVAFEWATKLGAASNFRYCTLVANRGKGGAVTHGMKYARGERLLFADADNASDFHCLESLEEVLSAEPPRCRPVASIVIGSRAHLMNTHRVIKRSKIRNFLMRGFHLLVYWFGIRRIKDTQCGFKLFTRDAAAKIFPYMHTEGWIFDIEALVIAMRNNLRIVEVPINWQEVDGSKVDLTRDSIIMAIDLVVIRFAYLFGIYKDGSNTKRDSPVNMIPKKLH